MTLVITLIKPISLSICINFQYFYMQKTAKTEAGHGTSVFPPGGNTVWAVHNAKVFLNDYTGLCMAYVKTK